MIHVLNSHLESLEKPANVDLASGAQKAGDGGISRRVTAASAAKRPSGPSQSQMGDTNPEYFVIDWPSGQHDGFDCPVRDRRTTRRGRPGHAHVPSFADFTADVPDTRCWFIETSRGRWPGCEAGRPSHPVLAALGRQGDALSDVYVRGKEGDPADMLVSAYQNVSAKAASGIVTINAANWFSEALIVVILRNDDGEIRLDSSNAGDIGGFATTLWPLFSRGRFRGICHC
jgi:hypothetical protein